MSDDLLNDDERRLWSIDTTRAGAGILGVVLVASILMIAVVPAVDPCWSTRVSYAMYGEDPPKMSPWRMTCERRSGVCVCTERTGELTGGRECVLIEEELEASCVSRARIE